LNTCCASYKHCFKIQNLLYLSWALIWSNCCSSSIACSCQFLVLKPSRYEYTFKFSFYIFHTLPISFFHSDSLLSFLFSIAWLSAYICLESSRFTIIIFTVMIFFFFVINVLNSNLHYLILCIKTYIFYNSSLLRNNHLKLVLIYILQITFLLNNV